jgi:hypothetical protein
MSTTLETRNSVATRVFDAGNTNLSAPEVRHAVAAAITGGETTESILADVRAQVVEAMANRGDKTDTQSVDKKFLSNGFQRPVYLGALIAQGIDADIVSAFTQVPWAEIRAAVGTTDAVEVLSSRAAQVAMEADERRKALAAAKASLAETTPAFKSSLEAILGKELSDVDKSQLKVVQALISAII